MDFDVVLYFLVTRELRSAQRWIEARPMSNNQFTRQSLISLLDRVLDVLTVAAAVAIPLFFLPITSEAFFINKHFLMFILAAVMLVLWTVGFVLKKQVKMTVSPLLLPMLLMAAGVVVSQIGGGGSPAEALIGRIGLYFSGFIIFMVGSSRRSEVGKWLTGALSAAAGILGLASILAVAGVFQSFGLADYTKVFTPAGGLTGALVAELAGLAIVLAGLKAKGQGPKAKGHTDTLSPQPLALSPEQETTGQALKKLGLIATTILIVSGAIIAGIMMFPRPLTPERSDGGQAGQQGAAVNMPLRTGWQIAIETLKEKPFFGVGTAAYLSAYTKYRPLTANSGDAWSQRILQAPNEILQTFTTNGLVGLEVLLFLLYQLYRLTQTAGSKQTAGPERKQSTGLAIGLVIVAASLLVLPLNVVSLSVLITLMTAMVLSEKATSDKQQATDDNIYEATLGVVAWREKLPAVFTAVLPWFFLVLAVILSGGVLFLTSRAWAAEVTYRQALVAIMGNDGTTAYNKLIQTIQWNPFIDTYHRQYADVNLRLANSLAGQQNLTDQDRVNVSQLVQQSIREGKIAVQLDPEDVQNWEILARTYRALINVAQGAGDWTLVAYSEAVRRDPVNPLLRLELGGVFYNLQDWESATRNFQAAVNLKPDYANGYYNLALAYEQDNRPERAAQAMQAALSNLRADSADYAAAQTKLTELLEKAKVQSTEGSEGREGPAAGGELKGREPLPTPLPGANRVELGEEEKPPVTPTPTAGPTPSIMTPTPSESPLFSPTPEL